MTPCLPLNREMLKDPIELRVEERLDFQQAQNLARQRAGEVCGEPLLLAWFDRGRGTFSPQVPCCREDKPSWLAYAESRGGNIVISLNEADFVFVFRGLPG
jgi:hypothetical protein